MHILILTSLYHPEIASNAKRMTHLAEYLYKKGYEVTVITAFPYYTTSGYIGKYKKRLFVKENHNNIKIIRTYTYSSQYRNIFKRLLTFISFALSSIIAGVTIRKKIDAIVTISPPFPTMFSAYMISRLRRAALVLDIQDIYPKTLIDLGFLKNNFLVVLLKKLEKFIYKRAHGISAISEGFRHDFMEKGVDDRKIKVIHNWVDIDLFQLAQKDQSDSLKSSYGLKDKFIVLFLGNHGFAQGLEYVIESGKFIIDYSDIRFVFVGDGVEKNKLINSVSKCGLNNFLFIHPQPNSEIPKFLNMADCLLVHLRNNDLYKITIPSKTYEYMASGKPIIMGVEGEAAEIVKRGNCGLLAKPEDPLDIANKIITLYKDAALRKELGGNGAKYAQMFSSERMLNLYFELINTAIERKNSIKL